MGKAATEQLTPGHARMKAMVQNPEAGFPLCNLGNKLVRVVNGNDLDPATSLYWIKGKWQSGGGRGGNLSNR